MELGLKRVMLVGGVAQRLLGKVAIVTGLPAIQTLSNIVHLKPAPAKFGCM